ncbi:MAG: FTR1 family iron permease, partial [Terriglobales bacterium]
MLQSLFIVMREGFEGFLIVAITLAYLRKTGRRPLVPAVYWGIGAAILMSCGLAYVLNQGVNQALWEAVLGAITVVLVATLVIQMWRAAPRLKREMEEQLEEAATRSTHWTAFLGVFLFTVLMISREGMETALMLYQVRGGFLTGGILGLLAAGMLAWLWGRLGHRINLKRFFQVTSIYLLLFLGQVAVYTFHEFAEAGLLPNSDHLHEVTEIFSPYGLYGKWFSFGIVLV